MLRRPLAAALSYVACVFGAGFVLGVLRVTLVVPRLGTRWAELLEMPLMAVVIYVAARWVVRRPTPPLRPRECLGAGGLALVLLLAAEAGLGMALRGASLRDLVAERDPVSGPVYALMLVVFALMPWLLRRNSG